MSTGSHKTYFLNIKFEIRENIGWYHKPICLCFVTEMTLVSCTLHHKKLSCNIAVIGPGICGSNFKNLIFKLTIQNGTFGCRAFSLVWINRTSLSYFHIGSGNGLLPSSDVLSNLLRLKRYNLTLLVCWNYNNLRPCWHHRFVSKPSKSSGRSREIKSTTRHIIAPGS